MSMDSGLQSLVIVAQLQRVAVDGAQLQHRFGGASEPWSVARIIRAARSLGFKARRATLPAAELDARVLPAIAVGRDGGFFVLARRSGGNGSPSAWLAQFPAERGPRRLDPAALEKLWSGELVLLRPGSGAGREPHLMFGLRWFLPALARYRRLFAEVVLASFFLQLLALATPLFFQVVMDKVLVHRGFTTLNVLAVGLSLVVVFEALIGGLRNYLFSHTANRVDVELGARLFHHLVSLPLAWFEARQVGQTVARVGELESLRNFITGSALTLLIDLSFTCVFLGVMWYYSPTLTWIVLGSLPCYIGLSLLVTPVLRARLQERFRCGAANQAFLTEAVTGIQTVKAQALEPRLQERWEDQLAAFAGAAFRVQNLGNVASRLADLFSRVTTVLIVWWGAHLVIAGELSVGQLVAFNMLAGRVTGPVLKLVQLWQEFQQAAISLRRLGDILDTPAEPGLDAGRSRPRGLQGAVRFDRVRFRYGIDRPLALDELDLEIGAGQVIGLVGRSGSGKSTVARLLQRLYVPEAGRVLVDGLDLALVDALWLRRHVGVVQQESFLFNRSVRDNIALADPAVAFERVVECARVAGAHGFIAELPEAYDTVLGEQGGGLSGGQRQRIAIARALLADPRILVLDEATSALDYESEYLVQQNMGAISSGRTVIVIAHRLSAVRHCDRIVVLERGRAVEAGTHDELLRAGGRYARLYRHQCAPPNTRVAGVAAASPGMPGNGAR